MPRIAIVPGDGIGQDVTAEAVKVLRAVGAAFGRALDLDTLPYGADHYLATGITIPPGGYQSLRDNYDAIFIGAVGDPRVPDQRHARDILLGIRFELDLYVNHRPIRLLDERLCPLKHRGPRDVDFTVFRENTEGLYAGVGGRFKAGTPDEIAIQEEINTYKGVYRIVKHAFEFARARRLTRLYIDALAMFMVKDPSQFQVIVTNNLFGDIITDLGAELQGGLGMAASANLHPGRTSMFEPVHGSAPPLAGKNVANPVGAILSSALMLETLGWTREAAAIESAVAAAVASRQVTADAGGTLGTRETGDAIAALITETQSDHA
jgi:3-isopropylmalate dehydrogenase